MMNRQNNPHHEIPLPGCTPEPLMGYLKALGVFRLIAEQADNTCRAAWRNGKLHLRTTLSEEDLARFFVEQYAPSPMFSPWNGDGGFLTESGTSFETIESIRTSHSGRLGQLKRSIELIGQMSILSEFGEYRREAKVLTRKKNSKSLTAEETERLKEVTKQVKALKEAILYQIRSEFPEQSLGWFDTCLQVGQDGFSVAPALGSGGVDGRMEFSANFLSNILLVLEHEQSPAWAKSALFAQGLATLHASSIGQFSPGHIGGPNATQGFEGGSTINPWDYILLIEGTPLLAGAMARRCNVNHFAKAAFPFTVLPVAQDGESVEDKDSNTARGEIWLPLWHRYLSLRELERLFGEGRAEWSGSQSRTNVDFAKAIASFGIDRGIDAFSRHGFLQRNGLAFLATPLGRFEVKAQPNVDLLREADPWIERYRRACGDKTPARFATALRRLDTAVFDYCRFGGGERFQAILIALGQAGREVGNGPKFRESAWLHPLQGLSPAWVAAADDGSDEFAIAAALAGIQGVGGYPGIRANLEPVEFSKGRLDWKDDSAKVVWKRGSLADNLCAVLERRLLDTKRLGLPHLPIVSSRTVNPATVARFISKELDEARIENLLWGLMCCKVIWSPGPQTESDHFPIPRAYPLLKSCFSGIHRDTPIPKGFKPQQRSTLEKLPAIKPDARLLTLLRVDQTGDACALAAQRATNASLAPARIDWSREIPSVDSTRLAAALLLPVSPWHFLQLWKTIERPEKTFEQIHA